MIEQANKILEQATRTIIYMIETYDEDLQIDINVTDLEGNAKLCNYEEISEDIEKIQKENERLRRYVLRYKKNKEVNRGLGRGIGRRIFNHIFKPNAKKEI